jgi:hypothetical protein
MIRPSTRAKKGIIPAMTTVMRATFDGKVLVPEGPVDLPVGKVLEVDVREASELRPGSPELIRRLMREGPRLSGADAEALELAIEEGQLPPSDDARFDDGPDEEHEGSNTSRSS